MKARRNRRTRPPSIAARLLQQVEYTRMQLCRIEGEVRLFREVLAALPESFRRDDAGTFHTKRRLRESMKNQA